MSDNPTPTPKPTPRPLWKIAFEIQQEWKNIHYAAVPYLREMKEASHIEGMCFNDSTRSVVNYFLSNATTWRGEAARRIKTELKTMLKAVK